MKTITLPVYKRAGTLKRTLDALSRNELDGYTLFVQAEPGHDDVVDEIRKIDFVPVSLEINRDRLGLNGNIKAVLSRAIESGSTFNVALEDDIILSPDAFTLAEWFRNSGNADLYACLGFFSYISDPSRPDLIMETQDFRSWGLCFGRLSWERHLSRAIDFRMKIDPSVKHQDMWDFWVQFYLIMNGIPTLHPLLSRSNHIGLSDGTNFIPELTRFFENKIISDGSYKGDYVIKRLPASTWESARKQSRENLNMMV